MTTIEIEPKRFEKFQAALLKSGAHKKAINGSAEGCAMEWAAYLAREQHSDHPSCVSPSIAAFMRRLNDSLPDDLRQELKPLVLKTLGTSGAPMLEVRRAFMLADWAVRTIAPVALDARGLKYRAATLRALPEIVDKASALKARAAYAAAYADAAAYAADAAYAAAYADAAAYAADAADARKAFWKEILPGAIALVEKLAAVQ